MRFILCDSSDENRKKMFTFTRSKRDDQAVARARHGFSNLNTVAFEFFTSALNAFYALCAYQNDGVAVICSFFQQQQIKQIGCQPKYFRIKQLFNGRF